MFVWAILTLWSQKNFRELSENFTFANWKFHDPAFVQIFKSAQIERMSKFEIIWDVKILKISYAFRTNKIIDVHDIFYPQVENFIKVSQLVPVRVRIRSTLSLKKKRFSFWLQMNHWSHLSFETDGKFKPRRLSFPTLDFQISNIFVQTGQP